MRRLPVAVVVEAAGFLEDAGELDAAGTHVVDVGRRGGVAVFEGSLFLGLAPEDFVVAIRIERRFDRSLEPDRCRSNQRSSRATWRVVRGWRISELLRRPWRRELDPLR